MTPIEQLQALSDTLKLSASYRKEYALSLLSRFREEIPEIIAKLKNDVCGE